MEGVAVYQTTTSNGLRVSSASAYIAKKKRSKNLKVISNAHVTKLIFEGKRVIGISFFEGNKETKVFTRGEVILSAGACLLYTSPSPRDKRQSRMPSSA